MFAPMNTMTPLERAFELAKSGSYLSTDEIRKKLKQEGYSVSQFTGRALFKQLRELINKAQREGPDAADSDSRHGNA
jgi:hypothetical protein